MGGMKELQSAWPAEPVEVSLCELGRRLYGIEDRNRNLRDGRADMLRAAPDRLACAIAINLGLKMEDLPRKSAKSSDAEAVWRTIVSRAEKEQDGHRWLHAAFLADLLFTNTVNGVLTVDEAVQAAKDMSTQRSSMQAVTRLGVAQVAAAMRRSGKFAQWQSDWLMALVVEEQWGDRSSKAERQQTVTSMARQMPLHANVLTYAYNRWLERKDWMRGEHMGGRPEKGPTFERPNAFMASWLETARIATQEEIDLKRKLCDVLDDLKASGHGGLVESLYVALCDEQVERVVEAAYKGLEWGPPWCKGVGWGWKAAMTLEQSGELSYELSMGVGLHSAGVQELKSFLRERLLADAGGKEILWFFQRGVDDDGYRELQPGWPAEAFVKGESNKGECLVEDEVVVAVWAEESRRGPMLRSPLGQQEFSVELWNKQLQRVDAKVYGVVYRSHGRSVTLNELMYSAYAFSQRTLLLMVDCLEQNPGMEKWALKEVVVIEGWERHPESAKGCGAEALRAAVKKLRRVYGDLGPMILCVEPLQYCTPSGAEPRQLRDERSMQVGKIKEYAKSVLKDALGDATMKFVDRRLAGDLTEVLRDARLGKASESYIMGCLQARQRRAIW